VDGFGALQGLGGILAWAGQDEDVAHLAAGPGVAFAVEVQSGFGVSKDLRPVGGGVGGPEVAQEVHHGGGSWKVGLGQGQSKDGAHVLLELAYGAGAEGEVAGVVGAGGDFVDQETAAHFEHLDGGDTDVS